MVGDIKVIGGSAHPKLARDICKHLGIEVCRSTVVRVPTRTCSSRSRRTFARPTSS
jgi:phosphoribosylpyrophosphate synthetase